MAVAKKNVDMIFASIFTRSFYSFPVQRVKKLATIFHSFLMPSHVKLAFASAATPTKWKIIARKLR
jgi:hypothetical protein